MQILLAHIWCWCNDCSERAWREQLASLSHLLHGMGNPPAGAPSEGQWLNSSAAVWSLGSLINLSVFTLPLLGSVCTTLFFFFPFKFSVSILFYKNKEIRQEGNWKHDQNCHKIKSLFYRLEKWAKKDLVPWSIKTETSQGDSHNQPKISKILNFNHHL